MRGLGDRVLLLSRQRVAVVVSLRRFSHGAFVERARESIKRHSIDHGPVAVLLTLARTNQQVGSLRHRLHTSGDNRVELSSADHLIGEGDRVDPRKAHLVDRQGRDRHAESPGDRRLTGCVLARTSLQDLAENHVVNVSRLNSRALERTGDRESSEVSRRQRRQGALQSAHRSSCSAKNNRPIAQTHLNHSTFPIFGPACRCHRLPARATIVAMHPLITRIDHVGIAVADFDEAVAFYARAFHMTVDHEEVNTEQGVREAMLRVGDSDSWIQILAPLSADSPIGRFLDRSGPGIQQMAYTVTDIDAVSDHLRSAGVRLLYDEPKTGTAGSRINFTHPKDSGGVLIELVQHAAE